MQSNGKKTTIPNVFYLFYNIFRVVLHTMFVISNLRLKVFSKILIMFYMHYISSCIIYIGIRKTQILLCVYILIYYMSCDSGGGTHPAVSKSPHRSAIESIVANNSAGLFSVTSFILVSLKFGNPLK